ncbi:hypothetical protein [Streptomyces melanogenes]|uniref:hypothetical protein n=1 Tax=Streptomyces melanogenes TaxID=67326 RepID=UPI00167CBFDB|nr:hypothetical protein [Streptomyces melanogenes]
MPAGWDTVTVTSPALRQPVVLTPVKKGAAQSAQVDAPDAQPLIRSDIAPGTYRATAVSHGQVIATDSLTLKAQGSADISRFVAGPRNGRLGSEDSTPKVVMRPGSEIVVLLADYQAAPDEESLTVTSKAFTKPLAIKKDSSDAPSCKCDDGTSVYAGHTALRDNLPAGTYELTVVSHHGQSTSTAQLKVAGSPERHYRPWLITGAALLVTAGTAFAVIRARRPKGPAPAP